MNLMTMVPATTPVLMQPSETSKITQHNVPRHLALKKKWFQCGFTCTEAEIICGGSHSTHSDYHLGWSLPLHRKTCTRPVPSCCQCLGYQVSHCVIFEDSPSGIRAGVMAGAVVITVCTLHKPLAWANQRVWHKLYCLGSQGPWLEVSFVRAGDLEWRVRQDLAHQIVNLERAGKVPEE
jgi:hypothetical protein